VRHSLLQVLRFPSHSLIMFDDTARMLVVSWVLFEGVSTAEAERSLACDRSTEVAWIKAYKDTGEWWLDPAIRNRHADNVRFDEHFVCAVKAVILSDPKQLLGEIKDVFLFLSTLTGFCDSYKCSIATLDRVLRAAGCSDKKLYRLRRERHHKGRRLSPIYSCQFPFGASFPPTRPTRTAGTCGDDVVAGSAVRDWSVSRVTGGRC